MAGSLAAQTQWVEAGSDRALELALVVAALALAIAVCLPAIELLSFIWNDNQFYGHAYAVPVVAGYFAFAQHRAIGRVLRSLDPPALGPLVVFGAAAFEVLMLVGDVGFAAGLGIPLVFLVGYGVPGIPGELLLFGGPVVVVLNVAPEVVPVFLALYVGLQIGLPDSFRTGANSTDNCVNGVILQDTYDRHYAHRRQPSGSTAADRRLPAALTGNVEA